MDKKPCVLLATLESRNHIVGDIERGIKIYERGGVDVTEQSPDYYIARVPHKDTGVKRVVLIFTSNGQDLKQHYCTCCADYPDLICRHKVAAVLTIQGGIPKSNLTLGKVCFFDFCVSEQQTAKAVGSGDLEVLATPVMITMMEHTACMIMADVVEQGQTTVGTAINVTHTAPSPIGSRVYIEAKITSVSGRTITFEVVARDEVEEIAKGTHTRVIVDGAKLLAKAKRKLAR